MNRRRFLVYVVPGVTFAAGAVAGWFAASTRKPTGPTPQKVLSGRPGQVLCVAISPDGSRVAAGRNDHTTTVWDASGKELFTLAGHTGTVQSLAFTPDGTTLASGADDNAVKLWDVATGTEAKSVPVRKFAGTVAFAADGRTLLTAGADMLTLWDARTGEELATLKKEGDPYLSCAAISPDGQTVATTHSEHDDTTGTIELWDVARQRKGELKRRHGIIRALAFSADGTRLASGCSDGIVWVWDARSGSPLRTRRAVPGGVNSLAFTPDGTRLAVGCGVYGREGSVYLLNVESCSLVAVLPGHTDEVLGVAVSGDGNTLVSGGRDGTVRLWNVTEALRSR
jgi:WD40 repeat protein